MAQAATMPEQGQIIVNIEDLSLLKDIKKAISMLKGVGRITVPRRKRYSSYELSMLDLKEGRVNSYASVDDFFQVEGGPFVSDKETAITPALRRCINKARKESQQGETIRCNDKTEMQQYFDSL